MLSTPIVSNDWATPLKMPATHCIHDYTSVSGLLASSGIGYVANHMFDRCYLPPDNLLANLNPAPSTSSEFSAPAPAEQYSGLQLEAGNQDQVYRIKQPGMP